MNPAFAKLLASTLSPEAEIYFCSDWHEMAMEIRTCLDSTHAFKIVLEPTLTPRELCLHYNRPMEDAGRFIDGEVYESKPVPDTDEKWLDHVPFGGVVSERDVVCENQWRAVYRLVMVRNEVVIHI